MHPMQHSAISTGLDHQQAGKREGVKSIVRATNLDHQMLPLCNSIFTSSSLQHVGRPRDASLGTALSV